VHLPLAQVWLYALKPDIAALTVKAIGDGVLAIRVLGAIHAAPRQ